MSLTNFSCNVTKVRGRNSIIEEKNEIPFRRRMPLRLRGPKEPAEAVGRGLVSLHLSQHEVPQKLFVGASSQTI